MKTPEHELKLWHINTLVEEIYRSVKNGDNIQLMSNRLVELVGEDNAYLLIQLAKAKVGVMYKVEEQLDEEFCE